jgi:hypothetical protein
VESTILEDVRAACAAVAAEATSVRIAAERLCSYARELAPRLAAPAVLDPHFHFSGDADSMTTYLVALDAVNFGSGYFPHLRKVEGKSGYFTVARRLKEHFESSGPLTAAGMQSLTAGDCARLFQQEGGDAANRELMELFARALRDLGAHLAARHGGSARRMVESAQGSAAALTAELGRMPFFADVASYRGRRVPFMKRAQLTCADLAIAFEGRGPGAFADYDRLTIFADNLVPHVLRLDGVLRYAPELVRRIEAHELIEPGSEEETEMRAGAVHAVELIVAELARQGVSSTAARVDYVLWNRGQDPAMKAHPRHRARTVYY